MTKTLHIKNIEKYHPGYKDRHLIWFKLYFTMLDGDDEFEMIEEIDKWRFVAFTVLELKNKKPIPLDEKYLIRKGFDFKKKSLQKTLDAISPFVDICNSPVTENSIPVTENSIPVTQNRIEYTILEQNKHMCVFEEFWKLYPARNGKKLEKAETIKAFNRLKDDDLGLIITCVKNYAKHVSNGIGIKDPKRFLKNDYWKNFIEKTEENNGQKKGKFNITGTDYSRGLEGFDVVGL